MKIEAQRILHPCRAPFWGMLVRFITFLLFLLLSISSVLSQTEPALLTESDALADTLAIAQVQTCPVACLTISETRSCFSIDVAQTNPNDQGEILISRPGVPRSITFEVLISVCTPGAQMSFFLNGVALGTVPVDRARSCISTPGVQQFVVNDAQLLSSAWNAVGDNGFRFVKTSTGSSYFSWVRVILEDGRTAFTACLNDYQGGNCNDLNQDSAGYTSSPIDISSVITNPFESIAARQPYSGRFGPAEFDLSGVADGLLQFCITGARGRDCIGFTKAGQTTLRINQPCNNPPTIQCPADFKAECSALVDLQFGAQDPDGDALAYTLMLNGALEKTGQIPAGGPPSSGIVHLQKSYQPGTYRIVFTVSDGQFTAECSATLEVADSLNPQLSLRGANPMSVECHTAFVDPGASAVDACAGDLTRSIVTQGAVDPNTPGAYSIRYTVADQGGNTATATRTVNVVDTMAPQLRLLGANPINVECHTSFVDPGASATDTCAGDLSRSVTVQGSVNPNSVGTYTIRYTVADPSGNTAAGTRTVNVVDTTPPQVLCQAPSQAHAGLNGLAAVPQISLSASDSCSAPDQIRIVQEPAPGTLVGVGVHSVRVTATDLAGNSSICETSFEVVNAAPVLNAISGPSAPVAMNSAVSLHVDFSDAEGSQGYRISVDWNDGSQSDVNVATAGGYDIQHTYSQAGVYSPIVTITDAPGASAQSVFQYVVVYDPTAGFVTGGGWINSPAGAYRTNPTLTGKANFGFVAKSKQIGAPPTGQTQFQLKLANFHFHSTAYEWLVISGAQAEFKGSGTVNGRSDYGFTLTAIDGNLQGGPDQFRIQIWDKTTGFVVYDNATGLSQDPTSLAGGSIVIHRSN